MTSIDAIAQGCSELQHSLVAFTEGPGVHSIRVPAKGSSGKRQKDCRLQHRHHCNPRHCKRQLRSKTGFCCGNDLLVVAILLLLVLLLFRFGFGFGFESPGSSVGRMHKLKQSMRMIVNQDFRRPSSPQDLSWCGSETFQSDNVVVVVVVVVVVAVVVVTVSIYLSFTLDYSLRFGAAPGPPAFANSTEQAGDTIMTGEAIESFDAFSFWSMCVLALFCCYLSLSLCARVFLFFSFPTFSCASCVSCAFFASSSPPPPRYRCCRRKCRPHCHSSVRGDFCLLDPCHPAMLLLM